MSSETRWSLHQLVAPMSPETFVSDHYRTRSAVIRGDLSKFATFPFDRRAFLDICRTTTVVAQFHGTTGSQQIANVSGDQAERLFEAGMTIMLEEVERYSTPIRELLARIKHETNYPGRLGAAAFLSPDRGGFGLHFDQQANFICQLAGAKRWTYSAMPVLDGVRGNLLAHPDHLAHFRASNPWAEFDDPRADRLEEVTLDPGDILYLPPAAWHAASAVDGPSLSISIYFVRMSAAELIFPRLHALLEASPGWRQILPIELAASAPTVGLPAGVEAFFADRLRELQRAVNGLTPGDLALAWRSLIANEPLPEPAGAEEVAPDTRLRSRFPVRIVLDHERPDEVHVFSGPHQFSSPAASRDFMQRLAEASAGFVAAEATAWDSEPLAWGEVADVLSTLLTSGILERVGAAP